MKASEEWRQLFEEVIGRTPTEIELLAAEKSHFNPQAILPISEGKDFEAVEPLQEESSANEPSLSEVPAQDTRDDEQVISTIGDEVVKPDKSHKEMIALPIISFVVSGLTIILGIFVKSPLVLVMLAILSLILGIVSFAVNVKKARKVLSLIALPLAIGALAIASIVSIYHVTISNISQTILQQSTSDLDIGDIWDYEIDDEWDNYENYNDLDIDNYLNPQAPFRWSEEKFRTLTFDNFITNDKGMTPDELVRSYGKANDVRFSDGYLDLTYIGETDTDYANLSFWQNEFGKWVLSSGFMVIGSKNLKTVPENSYHSTWTKAEFDKLIEGDYNKPELGNTWEEIHKKFGDPTYGEYLLSNYGEGFENNLNLLYTDLDADADKLSDVNLYFTEKNGKYYLTYKSYE